MVSGCWVLSEGTVEVRSSSRSSKDANYNYKDENCNTRRTEDANYNTKY